MKFARVRGLGRAASSGSRSADGYTIVEVTMFLAVSAVIFVAASLTFQGQQGKTQFEQNMNALAAQVQQYVSEVGTGIFSGSGTTCLGSPTYARPTLTSNNGSLGSNQGCIFLGNAIRVVPGSNQMYIYTVLGNQNDSSGNPVTSFNAALPTAIFKSPVGPADNLVTVYTSAWGKLSSSTITASSGSTAAGDMVGFYNSLANGYSSTTSGGQSISTLGYMDYTDSSTSDADSKIQCHIEATSGCSSPQPASSWALCYASTSSNQTATLTIATAPTGITTSISYAGCT